jgi:hypothetical protein
MMVRSLVSPRTGNAVANQFAITSNKGTFFQSYRSIIAKVDKNGAVTLSSWWDYSNTTRKYLYAFLSEFGYYDLNANKVRKMLADKTFKYRRDIAM